MSKPKQSLLHQVRSALRLRHYSVRTEEAYLNVIRRFIIYHKKRHPREMGVDEIRQYLSCHRPKRRRINSERCACRLLLG